MSRATALSGAAATAVLVLGLGNPTVLDAADELQQETGTALARRLTGFVGWDVLDDPADLVWATVLRLTVLLLAVGLLCGVAGRSRSRGAALIAGWGAAVVAAGVAGAAYYVYVDAVVFDDLLLEDSYLDALGEQVETGAGFALWTGWLVGGAVAAAVHTDPARRGAARPATARTAAPRAPWGTPGPPTTPGPWWAPDALPADVDSGVRPGASVFGPAGDGPPTADRERPRSDDTLVAPGPAPDPDATRPHPATHDPDDPDATRPHPATHDPDADDPDATRPHPATHDPAPPDPADHHRSTRPGSTSSG